MFMPVLRIKNALLSLLLSLVLVTVLIQPAYASNGNAYAFGKYKHSTTSAPAVSQPTSDMPVTAAQTSTDKGQKPATVPGDNGDIKTHNVNTPMSDQRDEPKVCGFYLDAFNFDAQQSVDWKIVKHTHGDTVLTGSIVLNSGNGRTADLSLPNGMYKVYWNFNGEHGSAKHKVFKVDCDTTPSTPPASSHMPVVAVKSNTCVVDGQMSGSVTVTVTNPNAKAKTYTVSLGKTSKQVTVEAGKSASVTFTDLKQGAYTVVVKDGCDTVKVNAKVEVCAETPTPTTPPVGRGGGQVLGESAQFTPAATLANTGDSTVLGSMIAAVLMIAGIAVASRRSNTQQRLNEIAL